MPQRVVLWCEAPRAGSPALIDAIRQRLSAVNGSVPVSLVLTMQDVYDASMTRTSFALVMLGIAAFMALVLGLVGIYGVIAYAATRRTREVGIRLTLGAQQRELRGMFLRQALVLTCVGIAIGLGAAAGVARVMTSLLFDVSPSIRDLRRRRAVADDGDAAGELRPRTQDLACRSRRGDAGGVTGRARPFVPREPIRSGHIDSRKSICGFFSSV